MMNSAAGLAHQILLQSKNCATEKDDEIQARIGSHHNRSFIVEREGAGTNRLGLAGGFQLSTPSSHVILSSPGRGRELISIGALLHDKIWYVYSLIVHAVC